MSSQKPWNDTLRLPPKPNVPIININENIDKRKAEVQLVSERVTKTKQEIKELQAQLQQLINGGLQKASNLSVITENANVLENESNVSCIDSTAISKETASNKVKLDKPKNIKNSLTDITGHENVMRTSSQFVLEKHSTDNWSELEHKCRKTRHHDIDATRKFIEKQKQKRREELKTQKTENTSSKDVTKQRLEKLRHTTQTLLAKNVQKAKKRLQGFGDIPHESALTNDFENKVHLKQPSNSSVIQDYRTDKVAHPFITIRSASVDNISAIRLLDLPKNNSKVKNSVDEKTNKAAILIQATFKGYLQRKRFKELFRKEQPETSKLQSIPPWLQKQCPVPYPYNFINTVKRKLDLAINQNSVNKTTGEHKNSISSDKSKNCDLKSFLSHKCLKLDTKFVEPLTLKSNFDNRSHQDKNHSNHQINENHKKHHVNGSDSDTSKNIPELSSESSSILLSKKHSSKRRHSSDTDDKFDINVDKIKKLKLRKPKHINFNRTKEDNFFDSNRQRLLTGLVETNKFVGRDSVIAFNRCDYPLAKENDSTNTKNISRRKSFEDLAKPLNTYKTDYNTSNLTKERVTSKRNSIHTPDTNIADKQCEYSSNFTSTISTSSLPSLNHPPVSLKSSVESLIKSRNKPTTVQCIHLSKEHSEIQTKIKSNEIHLKFEAQVHLLNDFHDDLRQIKAIEKSLLELRDTSNDKLNKVATTTTTYFSRDTQTSAFSKSSANINLPSEVREEQLPTVNYTRGTIFPEECSNKNGNSNDLSLLQNSFSLSQIKESALISSVDESSFTISEHSPNDIPIEMFDQLIQEEDRRLENLKAVLKIRERALVDRTKGELAWLEVQKRSLRDTGQLQQISTIKKKQRGLLIKLEHERHEMQRLKQMQKDASKKRKLDLREKRNMIKGQLSTKNILTTKIKKRVKEEKRPAGPFKVYNIRSQSESVQSETSISRRSSLTEDVMSVVSQTKAVISCVFEEKPLEQPLSFERNNLKINTTVETENAKRTLLMREEALQKRRKAAEELLQWHQRLIEEEKEIEELELAANAVINQNQLITIEKLPTSSENKFEGFQLNRLWKNMTGREEPKFKDELTYTMSKTSLEQFCKDAKMQVFIRNKNVHKKGFTSKNVQVNGFDVVIGENLTSTKHPGNCNSDESKQDICVFSNNETSGDYVSDFDLPSDKSSMEKSSSIQNKSKTNTITPKTNPEGPDHQNCSKIRKNSVVTNTFAQLDFVSMEENVYYEISQEELLNKQLKSFSTEINSESDTIKTTTNNPDLYALTKISQVDKHVESESNSDNPSSFIVSEQDENASLNVANYSESNLENNNSSKQYISTNTESEIVTENYFKPTPTFSETNRDVNKKTSNAINSVVNNVDGGFLIRECNDFKITSNHNGHSDDSQNIEVSHKSNITTSCETTDECDSYLDLKNVTENVSTQEKNQSSQSSSQHNPSKVISWHLSTDHRLINSTSQIDFPLEKNFTRHYNQGFSLNNSSKILTERVLHENASDVTNAVNAINEQSLLEEENINTDDQISELISESIISNNLILTRNKDASALKCNIYLTDTKTEQSETSNFTTVNTETKSSINTNSNEIRKIAFQDESNVPSKNTENVSSVENYSYNTNIEESEKSNLSSKSQVNENISEKNNSSQKCSTHEIEFYKNEGHSSECKIIPQNNTSCTITKSFDTKEPTISDISPAETSFKNNDSIENVEIKITKKTTEHTFETENICIDSEKNICDENTPQNDNTSTLKDFSFLEEEQPKDFENSESANTLVSPSKSEVNVDNISEREEISREIEDDISTDSNISTNSILGDRIFSSKVEIDLSIGHDRFNELETQLDDKTDTGDIKNETKRNNGTSQVLTNKDFLKKSIPKSEINEEKPELVESLNEISGSTNTPDYKVDNHSDDSIIEDNVNVDSQESRSIKADSPSLCSYGYVEECESKENSAGSCNSSNTNSKNDEDHNSNASFDNTFKKDDDLVISNVKKRVSEILADANLLSSRENRSPRLQDLYTTAFDIVSLENSPQSDSPTEEADSYNILPKRTYVNDEVEELFKKQLAIEQEIKQIQQQQQKEHLPYMYVREIPNKPPPPYKPPISSQLPSINSSALPASEKQIKSFTLLASNILFDAYQNKNLGNVQLTDKQKTILNFKHNFQNACMEFLFDLCKEAAMEHFKQFKNKDEPSWNKISKVNKLIIKLHKSNLETHLNKKVCQWLGYEFVKPTDNFKQKWSSKKRDHVDELLVLECQAEETEWTNYDNDELIVKDELTKHFVESLIEETIQLYDKILTKKKVTC